MGVKQNIKTKINLFINKNSDFNKGCDRNILIKKFTNTLFPLIKLNECLIELEKKGQIVFNEKLNTYRVC